jgi:hypothetical protein
MRRVLYATVFTSISWAAVAQGTEDATRIISELARKAPGGIGWIEGFNEPWPSNFPMYWNGKLTDNWGTVAEAQQGMYASAKNAPELKNVPYLGPSIERDKLPGTPANLASAADGGNIHMYAYKGKSSGQIMDEYLKNSIVPGKPVHITELGAGVGSGDYGFTPETQAKVLTSSLANANAKGVERTTLYQLFNYGDGDGNGDPWGNNGLFSTKGEPTQAAKAIHNLTDAVKPTGQVSNVTQLPYQMSGLPSTGQSRALQRGPGDYAVMVWDDVPPGTADKSPATMKLGSKFGQVTVTDPVTGEKKTYSNTDTVPVPVRDHPVVVQATKPNGKLSSNGAAKTGKASDFIDGIGVNVHLNDTGSPYGNLAAVNEAMDYLGVKYARDQTPRAGNTDRYAQLAKMGKKLGLIHGNDSGRLGVPGVDMGTGAEGTQIAQADIPATTTTDAADVPVLASTGETLSDTSGVMPTATETPDATMPAQTLQEQATPVSTGNGSAPEAAQKAGFATQTLGGGVWPDLPWKKFDFNGTDTGAINATFNGDGTATVAGGGNGYNAQLATAYTGGDKGWTGVAYGGGFYTEATLAIEGGEYKGYGMPGSDGWPAFWALDIERQMDLGKDGYELDFMEYWAQDRFGSAIHDWRADGGHGTSNFPPFTLPADVDWSKPHRYGFLWVPATDTTQGYAEFFFDGKPIPSTRLAWGKDDGSAWAGIDSRHYYLILGSGSGNPIKVSDVQVWQKDASQNISSFPEQQLVGSAGSGTGGSSATSPGTQVADNTTSAGPSVLTDGVVNPGAPIATDNTWWGQQIAALKTQLQALQTQLTTILEQLGMLTVGPAGSPATVTDATMPTDTPQENTTTAAGGEGGASDPNDPSSTRPTTFSDVGGEDRGAAAQTTGQANAADRIEIELPDGTKVSMPMEAWGGVPGSPVTAPPSDLPTIDNVSSGSALPVAGAQPTQPPIVTAPSTFTGSGGQMPVANATSPSMAGQPLTQPVGEKTTLGRIDPYTSPSPTEVLGDSKLPTTPSVGTLQPGVWQVGTGDTITVGPDGDSVTIDFTDGKTTPAGGSGSHTASASTTPISTPQPAPRPTVNTPQQWAVMPTDTGSTVGTKPAAPTTSTSVQPTGSNNSGTSAGGTNPTRQTKTFNKTVTGDAQNPAVINETITLTTP